MQFTISGSIYEQIVDYVHRQILRGVWSEDARLPSVRELAVELEVNPNTVQRAYTLLQDRELIRNQRGVGYFVAGGAADRAQAQRRTYFERDEVPRLAEELELLRMQFAELETMIRRYQEKNR